MNCFYMLFSNLNFRKWCEPRSWRGGLRHTARGYPRTEIVLLCDEHVNWRPYDDLQQLMPHTAQHEQQAFLARIPLIHYHVISWIFPDRVMRQFDLYQTVPPPLPVVRSTLINI